MQTQLLDNPDFSTIFIFALAIALAQLVAKYMTKLRSSAFHNGFNRSDHFDCLRIGVDFAFIGLVAGFGVLQALQRQAQDPSKSVSTLNSLQKWQPVFLTTEIVLLFFAILSAAVFYDSNRNFYRGIFLPGVFGVLSVIVSVMLFLSLVH